MKFLCTLLVLIPTTFSAREHDSEISRSMEDHKTMGRKVTLFVRSNNTGLQVQGETKSSGPSLAENTQIESKAILYWPTEHKECGGVIPLTTTFDSVINYKVGEKYNPDEFCVWTLAPQDNVINVRVSVKQNLTDEYDGIIAYFWNSTGLTSYKLPPNNTEFHFNTSLAFLVFSSDSDTELQGFTIQIYSTGEAGTRSTSAYHVRKDAGEFTYPIKEPERNRDRAMSLVLQRNSTGVIQTHLGVRLRNVDIEEADTFEVYILSNYFTTPDRAFIGRFTTDAEFEGHSFYPLLILLRSPDELIGEGFQVEWKEFSYFTQ